MTAPAPTGSPGSVPPAASGDPVLPAATAAADMQAGSGDTPGFRTTALIIACALFMQNLDATVLATALPTVARDYAIAPTDMSLALTSYLLALAIFIPASGSTADRLGARPVFQGAIALFVLGSVLCGFSRSLEALVAARFLQGIGGAMMVPVGRLVLLRSVAKRDLVSAMSWLAMPALIGPILGPPVGGLIVTYLDWRWIFWINVPMGVLGVVLVGRFIPDVRGEATGPFDRAGLSLSSIALTSLLFGLQMFARPGHLTVALPLLAVGLAAGTAYARHARRATRPVLDLSLLELPTFRLSMLGGTLARVAQGAQPFLLPLMLQGAFGLSAAGSGAVTFVSAVGSFAMKSAARPLLARFGFRTSLMAISLTAPVTYVLCGLFRPAWPTAAIYAVLLVAGFLTSLQFTAYNTVAYDEVAPARMSGATSFYATVQQVALSLGVCTGSTALALAMRARGHASPAFADFTVAYLVVAAISLSTLVATRRFAPDAGAGMTGGA